MVDTLIIILTIGTGIAGLMAFIKFIKPELPFWKSTSSVRESSTTRGRSILVRKDGSIVYVIGRNDLGNGKFKLFFSDGLNDDYSEGDIIPINEAQVLADDASPIFISSKVLESWTKEKATVKIAELRNKLAQANSDADFWQKKFRQLQSNFDEEVDKAVGERTKALEARKPLF